MHEGDKNIAHAEEFKYTRLNLCDYTKEPRNLEASVAYKFHVQRASILSNGCPIRVCVYIMLSLP